MRPDLKTPTPEILSRFAAIVGEKGVLTAPDDTEPYLHEWRGLYHGLTPMVLRPRTVEQVSAILKLAHEERIAIVPQGGNTGLVGGQIPFESGGEIVLSLNRMKAIRAVDPAGNSLTAEAGATLRSIQEAAAAVDRLFPLSLARRARVKSAATSQRTRAAFTSCAMEIPAISCWALRRSSPAGRSGTA